MKKLIASMFLTLMVVLSFSFINPNSAQAAEVNYLSGKATSDGITTMTDNDLSTYYFFQNAETIKTWTFSSTQKLLRIEWDKSSGSGGNLLVSVRTGGSWIATGINMQPTTTGSRSFPYSTITGSNQNIDGVRIEYTCGTYCTNSNYQHAVKEFRVFTEVVDTTPPTVPTNLVATPSSGSVALSWSASTDETSFAGYNLYLNGSKVNTSLITTTTYTASASNNVNNNWSVEAVDSKGNISAKSTSVMTHFDTISPIAPIGLTSTPQTDGTTKLTWTNNTEPDLAGYNIFVGSTKHNASLVTTNEYLITGLLRNTYYEFSITALDSSGNESPKSSSVSYLAQLDSPIVSVNNLDYESFQLDWLPVQFANNYRVYINDVEVNSGTENTYSITGKTMKTAYSYKVMAEYNELNKSQTLGSVTTLEPDKTIITASEIKHNAFNIDWTPLTNVINYKVLLNNSELYSGLNTNYSFTGLTPETRYTYKVIADFGNGNYSEQEKYADTLKAPIPTITSAYVTPSTTGGSSARTLHYNASDEVTAVKVFLNGVLLGEYPATQKEIELDYSGVTQAFSDIKVEPVDPEGKAYQFKALTMSTGSEDVDQIIEKLLLIYQVIRSGFKELSLAAIAITVLVVLFFWLRNKFYKNVLGDKTPQKLAESKTKLAGDTPRDNVKRNKDGFALKEWKQKDVGGLFRSKFVPDHTYEKNGIEYKYKKIKGKGFSYVPKTFNDKVKHVKHRGNQIANVFKGKSNRQAPAVSTPSLGVNNNIQKSSSYSPSSPKYQNAVKSQFGNSGSKSRSNKKFR